MAEKEYIEREEISQYLKDRYEYYSRKIKEAVYWDEAKAYRVLQVIAVDMFEYLGHRVPAADVTPVVHGEWIIKTNYKTPVSHAYIRKEKLYICPYCGKDYRQHMNFCGNCGAKMKGE